MDNMQWLEVPEPIGLAQDFVIKMSEVKLSTGRMEGEAALTSLSACRALRAYYDRVTDDVNAGCFDPDRILEIEQTLETEGVYEGQDGSDWRQTDGGREETEEGATG